RGTAARITQVFVTFSKPLSSTALDPSDFELVKVGGRDKHGTIEYSAGRMIRQAIRPLRQRDGQPATIDDSGVGMSVAMDKSSPGLTVVLTPTHPLHANRFYQLVINSGTPAGVTDLEHDRLAGNGSTPGTGYAATLGRGTRLEYTTQAGDHVK